MQTLDSPIGDQEQATIDQLIPRPPSRPKRFILGVALVGACVLFGWAWSTGWIIPQPERHGSATYGGIKLVESPESDLVIIGAIPLLNDSSRDLIVTDVRIDGLPIDIVESRWTPNGQVGGPARQFFVGGDRSLPAAVPAFEDDYSDSVLVSEGVVTVEAMDSSGTAEPVLDVYVRPDCDAAWPDDADQAGRLFLRYERVGGPAWLHSWLEFEQPLWTAEDRNPSQLRGLIDLTALDATDQFVEIESLRNTMCAFAGDNP